MICRVHYHPDGVYIHLPPQLTEHVVDGHLDLPWGVCWQHPGNILLWHEELDRVGLTQDDRFLELSGNRKGIELDIELKRLISGESLATLIARMTRLQAGTALALIADGALLEDAIMEGLLIHEPT